MLIGNHNDGMKATDVRKALESGTPLNSLYAQIPQDRRKALDRFVRCFGLGTGRWNGNGYKQ